jgi:hypothetical protein
MRGLPDSAVYGTYKRATRAGRGRGRNRRVSHGEDFFQFIYWAIYFVKWAKARWSK